MSFNKLKWVFISLIGFVLSDVSTRFFQSDVNYIVGGILIAFPLTLISGVMMIKNHNTYKEKIISKKTLLYMISYGTFQVFIGNILYFLAMLFGGLTIASPTVQSQSIWAVIIGGIFLKEEINVSKKIGTSTFIVGIIFLTYFKSQNGVMDKWYIGLIFGLLAGLSWSTASSVQKHGYNSGMTIEQTMFFGSIIGVILLLILGMITRRSETISQLTSIGSYTMLIPGTLNAVASLLCAKAIKENPISIVIPILSSGIIFNMVIGAICWNEYMNIGVAFSLLLILSGIIISQIKVTEKSVKI